MIIDTGNGTYTLCVDGAEVCKIIWLHGIRQCMWTVRGPQNLDIALLAVKEFAHLVFLLGNEKQVPKPPVKQVVKTLNMKENHGITKKQSGSYRFGRRGKAQS
jgi:hypothetical protein